MRAASLLTTSVLLALGTSLLAGCGPQPCGGQPLILLPDRWQSLNLPLPEASRPCTSEEATLTVETPGTEVEATRSAIASGLTGEGWAQHPTDASFFWQRQRGLRVELSEAEGLTRIAFTLDNASVLPDSWPPLTPTESAQELSRAQALATQLVDLTPEAEDVERVDCPDGRLADLLGEGQHQIQIFDYDGLIWLREGAPAEPPALTPLSPADLRPLYPAAASAEPERAGYAARAFAGDSVVGVVRTYLRQPAVLDDEGGFDSGVVQGGLFLFDLDGQALLCQDAIRANNSTRVSTRRDEELVQALERNLRTNVGRSINGRLQSLSDTFRPTRGWDAPVGE